MSAPAEAVHPDDVLEPLDSASGQVTTVIVDVWLDGPEHPVVVVRLHERATVLRGRVYSHIDPQRDIWEVLEPGVITVVGGTVLASGPAGPVRVIVSAVG